jgi:hypothetical protein
MVFREIGDEPFVAGIERFDGVQQEMRTAERVIPLLHVLR